MHVCKTRAGFAEFPYAIEEAARIGSVHAARVMTVSDILVAAVRGDIRLQAVIRVSQPVSLRASRDGVALPKNAYDMPPGTVVEGVILPLPTSACRGIANTGRANWRHVEETVPAPEGDTFGLAGELCRVKRWELESGEPDFQTTLADCRVMGWDIKKIATRLRDAAPYRDLPQTEKLVAPAEAPPQGRALKQQALKAELTTEWPSIARDLKEASRNGLKGAAYVGKERGWDVDAAKKWADNKGKLKKKSAREAATPFSGLGGS